MHSAFIQNYLSLLVDEYDGEYEQMGSTNRTEETIVQFVDKVLEKMAENEKLICSKPPLPST